MKKILLLFAAIICTIALSSKDLTGVKIYINPGHGGYDGGNDRRVPTPNHIAPDDTIGFWESSSNLTKGLYLDTLLRQHNATTMLSRTLNRDKDDRTLSDIAAESGFFGADHFLSIHSNASTGPGQLGANYLYLIYRGVPDDSYGATPFDETSRTMGKACFPFLLNNPLQRWTHYFPYNPANIKVAPQSLGVLNSNISPGFLSEGSFHDYLPEACRLVNKDYRKYESIRFLEYFLSYFGAEKHPVGAIAGYLKTKDLSEDIVMNGSSILFNYTVGTDDQWKILNQGAVTLLKANGDSIVTYPIDNNYNGFFMFTDLQPGTYKIRATADQYKQQTFTLTVEAGKTTVQKVFLQNSAMPDPGSAPDNYAQPQQDASVWPQDFYKFNPKGAQTMPGFLNQNNIKRVLLRNNKLYVLTNEPKILVYKASDYSFIKELSQKNIAEGRQIISDIAFTSDNFLVACNEQEIPLTAATTYFKVYLWDNDDADPVLHFQTQANGNWTAGVVGRTMAVSGPSWMMYVYTPSVTTAATGQIRVMGYLYKRGIPTVGAKYMMSSTPYTVESWGENFQFMISPRASDQFIVTSQSIVPVEYRFDYDAADRLPLVEKGSFVEVGGYNLFKTNGQSYFRYKERQYMVAPVAEEGGSKASALLFDITDGFGKAKKISANLPDNGLGEAPAGYMGAYGVVENMDMTLTVFAQGQGLASFKTDPGVAVPNIFASGLKASVNGANCDVEFVLNADASSVQLLLTKQGQTTPYEIELGALTKGSHKKTVPLAGVKNGDYTWSIRAVGAQKSQRPMRFNDLTNSAVQFYHARGVTCDNSFDSPFFGRMYVTNNGAGAVAGVTPARITSKGLFILNPLLEDVTGQGQTGYAGGITWANSTSSPFRSYVAANGDVYICDWADVHTGIWVMNPANPTTPFRQLFNGDARDASGLWKKNGVAISGSISSAYLMGQSEGLKLYTFDEDYVDAVATNPGNILRYDLGTSTDSWEKAPSAIVYNDLLHGNLQQNGNTSIYPDGRNGWWMAQNRSANSTAIPSLMHQTADGVVTVFGDPTIIPASNFAAFAVTENGEYLALHIVSTDIRVFKATYAANGVPSIELYTRVAGIGATTYGMAIDKAHNLWVTSSSAERLAGFALPKSENAFTTAAPSLSKISYTNPSGDLPEFKYAADTATVKVGDPVFVNVLTNPDSNGTVTYTSSNVQVATVDINGAVTPLATGLSVITANVSATLDWQAATVSYLLIVQKHREIPEFRYATTSVTHLLGSSGDKISNPLTNTSDGVVVYTSSDEALATVGSNGEVTALAAGTVRITATVAASDNFEAATTYYTLQINQGSVADFPLECIWSKSATDFTWNVLGRVRDMALSTQDRVLYLPESTISSGTARIHKVSTEDGSYLGALTHADMNGYSAEVTANNTLLHTKGAFGMTNTINLYRWNSTASVGAPGSVACTNIDGRIDYIRSYGDFEGETGGYIIGANVNTSAKVSIWDAEKSTLPTPTLPLVLVNSGRTTANIAAIVCPIAMNKFWLSDQTMTPSLITFDRSDGSFTAEQLGATSGQKPVAGAGGIAQFNLQGRTIAACAEDVFGVVGFYDITGGVAHAQFVKKTQPLGALANGIKHTAIRVMESQNEIVIYVFAINNGVAAYRISRTTGLEQSETSSFNVYTRFETICVETLPGQFIEVFDLMGARIESITSNSELTTITGLKSGAIYMVRVNGIVTKVRL